MLIFTYVGSFRKRYFFSSKQLKWRFSFHFLVWICQHLSRLVIRIYHLICFVFFLDNVEYWICVTTDRFYYYYYYYYYYYPILFNFIVICFVTYWHLYLIFYSFTFCCLLMLFICCQFKKMFVFTELAAKKQGHPTSIFGKYLFGRRFDFFFVKFLAFLPLLGFSNI